MVRGAHLEESGPKHQDQGLGPASSAQQVREVHENFAPRRRPGITWSVSAGADRARLATRRSGWEILPLKQMATRHCIGRPSVFRQRNRFTELTSSAPLARAGACGGQAAFGDSAIYEAHSAVGYTGEGGAGQQKSNSPDVFAIFTGSRLDALRRRANRQRPRRVPIPAGEVRCRLAGRLEGAGGVRESDGPGESRKVLPRARPVATHCQAGTRSRSDAATRAPIPRCEVLHGRLRTSIIHTNPAGRFDRPRQRVCRRGESLRFGDLWPSRERWATAPKSRTVIALHPVAAARNSP
jgi:hypothetical protein